MKYDVKDIKLADKGKLRIEWANEHARAEHHQGKVYKGEAAQGRAPDCLPPRRRPKQPPSYGHSRPAARVVLCASNPLSTQDDVAASLVKHDNIPTFAIKGEDGKTYYKHIMAALDIKPCMTMDDGADVVSVIHTKRKTCFPA